MQGITTALIGFILLALAFPKIIKNRPQYYIALVCVCLIILIDAVAGLPAKEPTGFQNFGHFLTALLQLISLICLVLSAGGLSVSDLASEMAGAYEVIRRGEEETEVIIPIPEHIRQKAQERAAAAGTVATPLSPEDEHKVYTIETAEEGVDIRKPTEPPKPRSDPNASLPLE